MSEEANNRNPPYDYLSKALLNRDINPHGEHHRIYNNNQALHGINPRRFLRFFRKTVKNVLNIDLEEKPDAVSMSATSSNTSTSSSTLLSSSTVSSASPTSHQTTRSNMNLDGMSAYNSSIGGSDNRHKMIIGTNSDGTPNAATPLPQGSGQHMQLQLEAALVDVNRNQCTLFLLSPPPTMNEQNIRVSAHATNPNVILITWPRGINSDFSKVASALTSGNHVITHVSNGQRDSRSCTFDPNDPQVVGLVDYARHSSGQAVAFYVFAYNLGRPFKPKLVTFPATNGITLQPKWRIAPAPESSAKAKFKFHAIALNIDFTSNDADEINYSESFDEDAPLQRDNSDHHHSYGSQRQHRDEDRDMHLGHSDSGRHERRRFSSHESHHRSGSPSFNRRRNDDDHRLTYYTPRHEHGEPSNFSSRPTPQVSNTTSHRSNSNAVAYSEASTSQYNHQDQPRDSRVSFNNGGDVTSSRSPSSSSRSRHRDTGVGTQRTSTNADHSSANESENSRDLSAVNSDDYSAHYSNLDSSNTMMDGNQVRYQSAAADNRSNASSRDSSRGARSAQQSPRRDGGSSQQSRSPSGINNRGSQRTAVTDQSTDDSESDEADDAGPPDVVHANDDDELSDDELTMNTTGGRGLLQSERQRRDGGRGGTVSASRSVERSTYRRSARHLQD